MILQIITFRVVTFCVKEVILFCVGKLLHFALNTLLDLRKCYYILRQYYILGRLLLHFAAIITFCDVTPTFFLTDLFVINYYLRFVRK